MLTKKELLCIWLCQCITSSRDGAAWYQHRNSPNAVLKVPGWIDPILLSLSFVYYWSLSWATIGRHRYTLMPGREMELVAKMQLCRCPWLGLCEHVDRHE